MLEQEYFRPKTLTEALLLKDKYKNDARVLAGGTDLIINLRENTVFCKYLIDIKNIPEMKEISYSEEKGLSIGGAVTLNDILENEDVKNRYKVLADSAKVLANSLIRNRATLLGNICNASPAADMAPASLVLEGYVEALSKDGERCIPLKDFFLGVKKNALKDNEIALRILFPREDGRGFYLKKSRIRGHDLSQIGAAGILKNDGKLIFAFGAAAPTPVVFDDIGKYKKADLKDETVVKEIIDKVIGRIHPISDIRASKEYRIAMAEYLMHGILEYISKEV